jgi:hypothetical protein
MTTTHDAPASTNPERNEVPPVTELNAFGAPDTGRFTDFMRYPLPPLIQREDVQFDGYGRYKLPSPTTGKLTSYTRATTLAKTISDSSGLESWKIREKVNAVLRAAELTRQMVGGHSTSDWTDTDYGLYAAHLQLEKAFEAGNSRDINTAIDFIHDLGGGADAREVGTAVHDWLDALDSGRVLFHQLPDFVQPYAQNYLRVLADNGLVAVPEYSERVVINTLGSESVAGRIDRIYRVVDTGELILGDLKTSKLSSLELAKVDYAIQFAIYGYAELMLGTDGLTWEPMPEINQDYCVVAHLPSDQPERASIVPFDLTAGRVGLLAAIEVREQRKAIAKRALSPSFTAPSGDSLRLVAARHALLNIKAREDASSVFEQYEDIWTDELTELGQTCLSLINPAATEEN